MSWQTFWCSQITSLDLIGPFLLNILPTSAGMRQYIITFINTDRALTISRVIYLWNFKCLKMDNLGAKLVIAR
jgi:hypothetical protein